jgi:4-carboxymuconolactone decarboxylase
MTPEGEKELDKIRKVRGYTLPLHEVMADVNPEFLRRYGELSSYVIFGPEEGRHLDLKTRFLVMVGVTTARGADREGIEWASMRAMQYGATWDEVREASFMAALPCGMPAFEAACRVFQDLERDKGWVPQKREIRRAAEGGAPKASKAKAKAEKAKPAKARPAKAKG